MSRLEYGRIELNEVADYITKSKNKVCQYKYRDCILSSNLVILDAQYLWEFECEERFGSCITRDIKAAHNWIVMEIVSNCRQPKVNIYVVDKYSLTIHILYSTGDNKFKSYQDDLKFIKDSVRSANYKSVTMKENNAINNVINRSINKAESFGIRCIRLNNDLLIRVDAIKDKMWTLSDLIDTEYREKLIANKVWLYILSRETDCGSPDDILVPIKRIKLRDGYSYGIESKCAFCKHHPFAGNELFDGVSGTVGSIMEIVGINNIDTVQIRI